MALFEVVIPAREKAPVGTQDAVMTLEAQNWIEALRAGLSRVDEGPEAIANILCDIQPDSATHAGAIHVTDVTTRRVFRLRELGDSNAVSSDAPPVMLPAQFIESLPPNAMTEPGPPPEP